MIQHREGAWIRARLPRDARDPRHADATRVTLAVLDLMKSSSSTATQSCRRQMKWMASENCMNFAVFLMSLLRAGMQRAGSSRIGRNFSNDGAILPATSYVSPLLVLRTTRRTHKQLLEIPLSSSIAN